MDGTMTDGTSIYTFKLMNDIFTYIFSIEMCIKLLAYGIKGYVKDTINVFDGSIVIISLIEVIFIQVGDNKASSVFANVKIFRTFRVLRVTKLLRSL